MSALANSHILLVDDSPDEIRLLLEVLRGTGARISIALDGAQGYDRAVARVPDLILMDVRMPKAGGIAACRQLKANPRTAHVPVIFLSASADVQKRLEGLHAGAVDYIVKPFSADEVMARVQIHLRLADKEEVATASRLANGITDSVPYSPETVLVQAAKHYLLDHLSEPPSLAELAQILGVNTKRLSRAFRQIEKTSVFGFLRAERMRAAQGLLTDTSLSVVAIADELGFSRASNFSTAFFQHSGMAPGAYRIRALNRSSKEYGHR